MTTISVSVDEIARSTFFEQLKTFAEKHAFAIRVAPVRPDGEHFIVQMWREDLKVIGVNPFESQEFEISFYANDEHPLPGAHLDALVSDLRHFIGDEQGVIVVVPSQHP